MQATVKRMHAIAASVGVLTVAALSGCGGGSVKAGQVAVKVNKDEITVLQVNEQLSRLPAGIAPDLIEPLKRKVVSALINEQLLVQQAVEHKLDRDPGVILALDSARRKILAQAYVQHVITPQAKPTEQEIRNYYADNPALFSERKVYRLHELTIDANPEQEKAIEALAGSAHSLKQVADYLHEQKISFSAISGVRSAEQLPLAHLPQIAQLKPGGVLAFPNGDNHLSAVEVLAVQSQPVDDKKATPGIEQYLTNRKRDQLAADEMKRLRDAAKVEYMGDFAKYAEDSAGVTKPASLQANSDGKAAAASTEKGIAALH